MSNKGRRLEDIKRKLMQRGYKYEFKIEPPYTVCYVSREKNLVAAGISICSCEDRFEEYLGKTKAAGRALKAIIRKQSSGPVRSEIDQFPPNWTVYRAMRLTKAPFCYKSLYLGRIHKESLKHANLGGSDCKSSSSMMKCMKDMNATNL